jgi:hypothetical protein
VEKTLAQFLFACGVARIDLTFSALIVADDMTPQ